MYLKFFQKTTPLSKYLQGHGINIVTAYHIVKQTFEDLRKISRDFSSIVNATNNFVEYTNTKLNEIDGNELEISNCLPEIRQRKKTRQFIDYESNDEPLVGPLHVYKINVYNPVLDTVIESISSRFEKHGQLCADFACLDPNNFEQNLELPKNALFGIFDKIVNFIPEMK